MLVRILAKSGLFHMKSITTALTILLLPLMSFAYEQAFPKTAVDTFEIKVLPEARSIASQSEGAYFSENNGLFRPLFRYISSRDIAMTTPVEAEIEPGIMYFYIGSDVSDETLEATDEVSVHTLPERKVASYGVRGGYSERNFEAAKKALEKWLSENEEYEATGPARGIFWNGPYVPGFFKRFEVHIPVAPRET